MACLAGPSPSRLLLIEVSRSVAPHRTRVADRRKTKSFVKENFSVKFLFGSQATRREDKLNDQDRDESDLNVLQCVATCCNMLHQCCSVHLGIRSFLL